MQYSFFSAASNPKSSLFLHQKVVAHLNLGCLSRFRRKCKDTPYLSMALRITCLLATCLLTRLILPIIKTLLAAQCHLTDTQNLDSLTINFPRLKSGVRKNLAFGPKSYTTCNAVRAPLKESKQLLQRVSCVLLLQLLEKGVFLIRGLHNIMSGRACLQSPHLTQSGAARNQGVDRSRRGHIKGNLHVPMYQRPLKQQKFLHSKHPNRARQFPQFFW